MADQRRQEPRDQQERRASPWPARIVGGITVLATVAILLAVFLPRERPLARPETGPDAASSQPAFSQGPSGQTQRNSAAPQHQPMRTGPSARPQAARAPQTPSGANSGQAPQQGKRWVTCPDCGGRGQIACPMKHLPNGHLLNPLFWKEERYYSGDDPLLPDEADLGPCPICHGTLRTTCPRCSGKGQIVEGTPPPANPFGELGDVSGAGVDPEALKGLLGDLTGGGQ